MLIKTRYSPITPEEAQRILDDYLGSEDQETLDFIRRETNQLIRWGELINESFPPMLDAIENVFNTGAHTKKVPLDNLLDIDLESLYGDDPRSKVRRRYVFLHLLKKLLGGLKTRVNQELKEIIFLSSEDEDDLTDILEEGGEDDVRTGGETQIIASLEADGGVCEHPRTKIRRITGSMSEALLETYCKDCRKVVMTKQVQGTTKLGLSQSRKKDKKPKVCTHSSAHWKEGEEGRTAICSDCQGIVPNPQKFEWIKAGLEPFGDDPEQDEVIKL